MSHETNIPTPEELEAQERQESNRKPMPGFEFLTMGRVREILTDIRRLADAYACSTTDRNKVCDLIGKVLTAWEMEFRLRNNRLIEK